MWENNLGVSDVEGYKRKKGVGRYWKYIKLCAALLLYLAAVRSNAHVQARAGYAAAFLNDRAVTAKEAEQICEAEAEQEYPAAICFFKEQPDTSLFCRETGEASVVNQIRIIGNAELLMYGSNALSFRKKGLLSGYGNRPRAVWHGQGCRADGAKRRSELAGTWSI